jgi:regulator of RNase E activity RraB
VPGALMTILGYNILKQVIVDENLDDLEKIFFRVNQLFYNVFKSEAVSKNDGMALSVVCVNYEANTLSCLAAQQSIIILDTNNALSELKFHSTPINYPPQKSYFTKQSFHLSSIARIILFSDGIIDQKGGPENKFLKKIGFKNWIIEKKLQNKYYSKKTKDWMSTTKEQIDDILVLDITFFK